MAVVVPVQESVRIHAQEIVRVPAQEGVKAVALQHVKTTVLHPAQEGAHQAVAVDVRVDVQDVQEIVLVNVCINVRQLVKTIALMLVNMIIVNLHAQVVVIIPVLAVVKDIVN